ncbi:MAG: LemA family protein [Candidatus Omnitrophica bacterium]|nr:Protein LemA [bacterium]NUN96535.1 LemA family protein [Candidatus Omnitrophota bacterium]
MEWIVVLGILVLIALFVAGLYNSLVRLRQQVKNAWSQIDVQLKRRYDLIPNLVETAKGYLKHERETLEAVVKARQMAIDASTVKDQIAAENMLTSTLRSLFAVAEAYPDLKANQNMIALQEELASTENKIGFARQFYNDQVMHYNTRRETFPTVLLAGMFGFGPEEFFEIELEAERAAPKVQF